MPTPVCSISAGGHQTRVLAARDALVVAHLALVAPIAKAAKKKLPPSFDLDELLAVGNFALVRAATRYRPAEHGGTPFSAYARSAISGAIRDTFRRNKFAEQTRPGLAATGFPGGDVLEFPVSRIPAIEARIDQARRFAALRNIVTVCLPPLQVAVFDEYYTAAAPELADVGRTLGITRGAAERAHASGIRTLRERMKTAA